MQVGFIGLGAMGGGMARSLLRAGHALAVYDTSPQILASFAGISQCRVVASCHEAAQGADAVITMLPTSADTHQAVWGEQGLIYGMQSGQYFIEMSTGNVQATLDLAAALQARGIHFLDAPVNRAPPEAESGDLQILVGGEAEHAEALMPLFRAMGNEIHVLGTCGNGIKLKLANNYMSMINLVLSAEAILLAERAGIERELAVRIMSAAGNGATNGQLTTIYPRKVLAGDLTPDFRLAMCHKDISLALEMGGDLGLPLYLGAVAKTVFSMAKSWGREQQDCTAVLHLLDEMAGGHPESAAPGGSVPD